MTRLATAVTVCLLSAHLLAQSTPPADKALAVVQGIWVVNDVNGKPAPPMLLLIKGDRYEHVVGDKVVERGIIKVDAAQKPMIFDMVIQEGQDAGTTQLGIVEVAGETMKLKLSAPGGTRRPTSFNAEEGFLLGTLTRRK